MYGIRLLSSIIAGIIILFSIFFGFLYISLAFFVAGIISLIIIYPFIKNKTVSNSKKHGGFGNIKEGFKFILKEKGLFQLTLLSAFLNMSFGITFTYLVVYIISGIHGNALIYGIVLGVYPLVYVIGSFIAGYSHLLKFTGKIWILHAILSNISFIIIGLYASVTTVIIFYIIIGISVDFSNNVWLTSAHNIVPREMYGRYFGIDSFFTSIFGPISIISGIINTFIISGIIMVLFSLIFLFMKSTYNFNGNKISNIQ